MAKTLCDLKKLLKTHPGTFMKLVREPTHLCRKCGRVANSRKLLCKPVKFDERG